MPTQQLKKFIIWIDCHWHTHRFSLAILWYCSNRYYCTVYDAIKIYKSSLLYLVQIIDILGVYFVTSYVDIFQSMQVICAVYNVYIMGLVIALY